MFVLEGNLTFINIDQDYLKRLHDVCTEVYYKPRGYENKPYIGILINKEGRKYVIPLTSAKRKHASWRDVTTTNYRVYEEIDTRATIVDKYDIIVDETDLNKLRQKGIPEDEQRRNLMVKEYFFCKKYKKQIEAKAKKIYEKQMVTGGVAPYHCNYKVLESVVDTYK